MGDRPGRRWIPLKTKAEVCSSPCRVCGSPYELKCDHIVPVVRGGTNDRENLQSLCHDCNHIKGSRLTNEEVRAVVKVRGLMHFYKAVWRHDTRYENKFDRRSVEHWLRDKPGRGVHAEELYAAFLKRSE